MTVYRLPSRLPAKSACQRSDFLSASFLCLRGLAAIFYWWCMEKKKKKERKKFQDPAAAFLKEDRRVLRMHAFVFLLKLHNKSLY